MANIRIDPKEFVKLKKFLTDVERRQIPFAQKNAMNDVMFSARRTIVDTTWPQSVTVRNKRFMGAAMRIEKATKRKLDVLMYDRFLRGFLGWQIQGGNRTPARGAGIAVPTTFTESKRSKTTGKMGKAWQPRNPKFTYNREKQIVTDPKRGRMYTVKGQVTIKPAFPFYVTVANVIDKRFPKLFEKAFNHAVNTAIRR